MARAPRVEYAGAIYHVTSRGNARQAIFAGDDDRRRFLAQLEDGLTKHRATLYAFVLMGNHYHLLVRTNRPNLSVFMQWLNTSYSLYHRYRHARPGHLFQGRYTARVVDEGDYLRRLIRYVHLNPIKIRRVAELPAEERARQLDRYPWSSYPGYVNAAKAVNWVDYRFLREYGRSWAAARRRYRAYTRAMVLKDDEELLGVLRENTYAVGDDAFVDDVKTRLAERRKTDTRKGDVSWPEDTATLDRIDAVVAASYGVEASRLGLHGLAVGEAKRAAMELAVRHSGCTMRAIGEHYGGVGSSAVAMARRAIRSSCEEERERVEKLSRALAVH